MRLPYMKYSDRAQKYEQVSFGGIDRRKGAGDGSIYDLKDITTDDYPVLSTVPNRYISDEKYDNPWYYGMADKPFVIAGREAGGNYPVWNSGTAYGTGVIRAYDGRLYQSIDNVSEESLMSIAPMYATEYWKVYDKSSFQYDGVWAAGGTYTRGNIYLYSGKSFYCVNSHSNSDVGPGEDIVNWEPYTYASLYYNGKKISGLELYPGKKECVYINDHIIIMPDKMYYNVHSGKHGYLKGLRSGTFNPLRTSYAYHSKLGGKLGRSLTWFMGDSKNIVDGASGYNDVIIFAYWNTQDSIATDDYLDLYDLRNIFREDDSVNIKQYAATSAYAEFPEGYYIVREVGRNFLRFDSQSFSGAVIESDDESGRIGNGVCYDVGQLSISKDVPDMDYLCNSGNRIWGCKDDTVYASGLGNPFAWQNYTGVATDAVYLEAGTIDKFTGCCEYSGYPMFFKENEMYIVYGNTPSAFALQKAADIGIKKDSPHSVCVVNSILMFLSAKGIYAYTGGVPAEVSGNLNDFISECTASTDGLKYYGVMTVGDERRLYVYDAGTGLWSSEHIDADVLGFAWYENDLRCMKGDGEIFTLSKPTGKFGIEVEKVENNAVIEFNDFYNGSTGAKDFGRMLIRASVDPGYDALYVYVQYDSDGVWHRAGKIYNQSTRKKVCEFGFFPRRCDHFRIKLECLGKFTVYSIARQVEM